MQKSQFPAAQTLPLRVMWSNLSRKQISLLDNNTQQLNEVPRGRLPTRLVRFHGNCGGERQRRAGSRLLMVPGPTAARLGFTPTTGGAAGK